ncbi:hypothetical protein EIP91_004764 [Steccherinum ochraceum]|uniref:DUF6533 domain-containing protein n=1 Tax=Steccherinum ochraceum TaxID=92696 RepID=A0A4V2MVV5_9APHY|nr:hypothetical protein EIP91_004764 [Steccherinum ochraceum]
MSQYLPTSPEAMMMYSCYSTTLALAGYDILLTFSREVECIWRRKWSFVTILFVSQRYFVIFGAILRYLNPWTLATDRALDFAIADGLKYRINRCMAVDCMTFVTSILCLLGTAGFTALRTWALYGRFNASVFAVLVCSMFEPFVNIYNYSRTKGFFIDEGGCGYLNNDHPADAYCSSFPDTAHEEMSHSLRSILIITWHTTTDARRASSHVKHFTPKLSMVLLEAGTTYFVLLSFLNIATLTLDIIVFLHPDVSYLQALVLVPQTLAPVLIARFILDLRTTSDQSLSTQSSVRFNISELGRSSGPSALGVATVATGISGYQPEKDHGVNDIPMELSPTGSNGLGSTYFHSVQGSPQVGEPCQRETVYHVSEAV